MASAELERHGPRTRREIELSHRAIRRLQAQLASSQQRLTELENDVRSKDAEIERLRELVGAGMRETPTPPETLRAAQLSTATAPKPAAPERAAESAGREPLAKAAAPEAAVADSAAPESAGPRSVAPDSLAPRLPAREHELQGAPISVRGPHSSRWPHHGPASTRSIRSGSLRSPERTSHAPPISVSRSRWEVLHLEVQDQDRIDIVFQAETRVYSGLEPSADASGVFVATYRTLPLETRVNVHILTGRGVVHVFLGEVRWVREAVLDPASESLPGLGIAFLELSEADRDALTQHFLSEPPIYFEH